MVPQGCSAGPRVAGRGHLLSIWKRGVIVGTEWSLTIVNYVFVECYVPSKLNTIVDFKKE